MERTLNKISQKLKTNLDKFSYESSYAKLNDSKFNVSQANESETYSTSASFQRPLQVLLPLRWPL